MDIVILKKALGIFIKTTKLVVDQTAQRTACDATIGPDALIRIAFQDMERHFAVKVKKRLTRAAMGIAVQQLREYEQKGLLVTRYVTPQMADLLKEMDIPFIDTVGNVYINEPPLYIFIKGNKLRAPYQHAPLPARAFRPAGLKVVYALLCNPGLENAPLREIAREAAVALGTVGIVIGSLRQMGYLIVMGTRGRRLTRKDNLLTRWVTAYPEQLRPKLILGRYRAENYDWWKNADLNQFKAYWGGEIAAAVLTKYLKPQNAIIYTHHPLGNFLLNNRIKKDPNGNIEILKVFWKFKYLWQYPNLVHPILVYADLLATGDRRNIETARIIYEQKIKRRLSRDRTI
ncbi:MAG: type IV toxin-antitoxin system AbiEi family antitoxin [Candidatus Tritonobacter lacicola]|nr:type IV toxin-antitoxin system AbiEi family antitoxin [Candidatus Tritonobacter lacicola]